MFVALVALRIPLMNAGLFHHDEVLIARAVERSLAERKLFPPVTGRYGTVLLGLAFHAPYHLVTGASAERSIPFMGIVMGALLCAALLLLAHELTVDRLAAAFAPMFAASSTLFLTSSSTGKENVPLLAFAVLACWLFARGARTGSAASRLAGVAAFGFALSMHEGAIVIAPAHAAFMLGVHLRSGPRWSRLALDLGALAAAISVPLAGSGRSCCATPSCRARAARRSSGRSLRC